MTKYFSHRCGQNGGKKRTDLHCFDAGHRIPPNSVKISLAMTARENTPTLVVIDGGRDFARKQWLLFNQPWRLDLDEFEEMARVPAPIIWTRFCNSGRLSHGISLTGFEG